MEKPSKSEYVESAVREAIVEAKRVHSMHSFEAAEGDGTFIVSCDCGFKKYYVKSGEAVKVEHISEEIAIATSVAAAVAVSEFMSFSGE